MLTTNEGVQSQMVSCFIKRSHRQSYRRVENIEAFLQDIWSCNISESPLSGRRGFYVVDRRACKLVPLSGCLFSGSQYSSFYILFVTCEHVEHGRWFSLMFVFGTSLQLEVFLRQIAPWGECLLRNSEVKHCAVNNVKNYKISDFTFELGNYFNGFHVFFEISIIRS